MSIFSSLVSGVKNAASSVYNFLTAPISSSSQTAAVYNALNTNNPTSQTLQKQLNPTPAPYGSPDYYQASSTYQGATTLPSASNPKATIGPASYGPTLPVTISAGKVNPGGGVGNQSYGPQAPSGGGNTLSGTSSLNNTSLAPQTISTTSLTGIGGGGSFSSTGGASAINLAGSAPSPTSVGKTDTTGLAGAMAAHYKRNADGTFSEITPTDSQQSNTDLAKQQKDLYDSILGPKPDVYSDPAVMQAQQQRNQIMQAIQAPTAELNAVVSQQNQDLLQLRQTGQREGVTEAVYGRQKDAIDYNAAIRALPLQAQLANLQGQEKLAQDYLTQLTQVKTSQINNQYEYNKGLFTSIESAITKKDQRAYDEIKTHNERTYQEQRDLISTQDSLLKSATSQGAPSSIINAINNAKTQQEAITAAGRYSGNIIQQKTDQVQYQNAVLTGQKLQNEIDAGKPASGEYAPVINAVSSLVGATKAPAVKTAIASSLAKGDYATAYANVANAVEDSLTGSNKTKFADTRTDIGVMSGMRNAIKAYTDAGGSLGYLKGTTDKIAKNFGQLSQDPKFAALGVQLAREFQSYRLAMTGAAFSPAESKEYAAVNPRTNASLDLNLATIDGALAQLSNRVTSTVNERIPEAKKIYDLANGNTSSQSNNTPVTEGKLSSGVTFKVIK